MSVNLVYLVYLVYLTLLGRGVGGPGRKFYSITPEGKIWLSETTESWQDFTAKVAAVLTLEGNPE
ncbi:hypothetical protein D7003_13745 [Arthrobacter oryzae]|uniref:PadR family transcriptional regulator n=1 Tax=Arthrobacter oryzae TaxID=409290 RepID=A0A3N0BUD7_9MICC|nr:hypothetical protein D7003_13745 [Arthrobacter oryzae]